MGYQGEAFVETLLTRSSDGDITPLRITQEMISVEMHRGDMPLMTHGMKHAYNGRDEVYVINMGPPKVFKSIQRFQDPTTYTELTEEELKEYRETLKPISHRTPSFQLAFIGYARRLVPCRKRGRPGNA